MNHIAIKKIDKLLLRTFITTFILLLALVLFVMVIQSFFALFSEMAGKGLGAAIYAKLLFYLSLNTLPNVFPIATLVTSLIVFGNFSESFELTAMRSVGLSLQRTLRFPFIFILCLSAAIFYFKDYIYPSSKHKIFALVGDICKKKSALLIQEGVFCNNIPGYSIRVDKKLGDQGMEGIMVYDYTKKYGTAVITVAEKGRLYTTPDEAYLVMELTNGHNYVEPLPPKGSHAQPGQKPSFYRNHFVTQKIKISLEALKLGHTNAKFAHDPRTRTRPHLKKMIAERAQAIVHQEAHSKSILTQQAMHYAPATDPSTQLEGHQVEGSASSQPEATERTDFILFRDQLIEKKTDANTTSYTQSYGHTLQKRVIREALRRINKIKDTLVAQEDDKALLSEALNEALYERACRLAIATQCVIFFLLAAPLGCIIRRGGFGISVCISFFFILLEYILAILGKDWAVAGTVSTFVGVWLSNFVLLPFCAFFLIKAQQGRGLCSTNWYTFCAKIKTTMKRNMHSAPGV